MRRRLSLPSILIPVAAMVVVLPLIVHGCSCGHDFDFHLISWMEAAAQFRSGVWHPTWAFSPAWNAGEPRFVFYPPISWTIGALLGLTLPWTTVPIAYTWLALTAGGFAMYWLARELEGSRSGATLAAVVYLANPYMIFTAYERTAYAELLAAAWIPLLLAAVLRERVTVLRVAIPVALLWLTNAPAAVMGCYALALLTAVRLVLSWRNSTVSQCAAMAARTAEGVLLGLSLAAFYLLPAAYERRWVQIAMATVGGMRISDNFLFHHTRDALHDAVLRTASEIAVGILVSALLVLGLAALRFRNARGFDLQERTLISIAGLVFVIGLMLMPQSAPIWRVAPEMSFLQFPWRLAALLAAAVCSAIPSVVTATRMRPTVLSVGALALVAAMSWPAVHAFRQACDDEDNVEARLNVFRAKTGTDPTDEYTPGDSDNDALLHANPAFWLAGDSVAQSAQGVPGQVPMHFAIDTKQPETLAVNLRDYPAWRVRVNGTTVDRRIERPDGLIAFPVAAGHSQIDISYGVTGDRELGEGISVVAFCSFLRLAVLGRRRSQSRIIEG